VKHTAIFGLGSLVQSAFGFFLVPLYARHLKASQFGVLSLLTITLTLVSIVLKFGLNHAFFRHYYETEDPERRRQIVGTTLVFLLASSLGFTALLYMLSPELSVLIFSGDASRAELLQLVFLICFFEVVTVIPDAILRANFKSARYSAISIVAFAAQLVLISYMVIIEGATVENVLKGRLAGVAFEAAVFFVAVRRDLSLSFSAAELRGMLAFGSPLIFGQVAATLFMMIDRFFLERYSTNAEVGFYSMANSLVMAVTVLVTVPFSQVWTVMRFSVMNEEGAEEYYSHVLTYIVYVSMFLALGVAAVAGDGLLLYASKSYYPAAALIPLLAMAVVLDGASRVLNIGLTMRKKTLYAPLVIFAALGINIALNFLLIPRYASLGATVATLLSYVAYCALRYWASNLFLKVRYEWGRVFTMAAVGGALVAAFYLSDYLRGDLSVYAPEDPARRAKLFVSAAVKGALALSFPLVLAALKFYNERERRRLAEIWQKLVFALRHRKLKEASAVSNLESEI
jgi:O-antigen/teichoic acid export membrane protein